MLNFESPFPNKNKHQGRQSLDSLQETIPINKHFPRTPNSKLSLLQKLRFCEVNKRKIEDTENIPIKLNPKQKIFIPKILTLHDLDLNQSVSFEMYPDSLFFNSVKYPTQLSPCEIDEDCGTSESIISPSKKYLVQEIKFALISENL